MSCPAGEALLAHRYRGGAADELERHLATCPQCNELQATHEGMAAGSATGLADTQLPAARALAGATSLLPVDAAHYQRERELGAGGMGRTYRAFERRLGRVVALKEIRTDTGADPQKLVERFEHEVRLTARLQHPSIVTVYEAGRFADEPFYAMRLVDGVPLDDEIRRRKTLAERLALVSNVASVAHAIAYAHDQRVIHRDLKPANIVIGKFGETVVIDWGLAWDLDAATHDDDAGAGTPAYMPPEQATGDPPATSFDIYAIGATLYHVLAGHPPFADLRLSRFELMTARPSPLDACERGVPRDLVAIVDKAMARDRRDRYATAAELADDLAHFLAGRLVAAYEYSRRERLARWLRRHKLPLAVATVAAIAIAAIGVTSVRRIVAERERADAAREVAQARADELVLRRARDQLATDPTASLAWLAQYPSDGPGANEARLIAAEATSAGAARHVLAGNTREVRDVAITATRVASAGADGSVWLWDAATGRGRALAVDEAAVARVAFSPDGSLLAAGGTSLRIWKLDRGGASELVVAGSRDAVIDAPVTALAWSPDGRRLVTAGARRVAIRDVATAMPTTFDATADVLDIAFAPDGAGVAAVGRGGALQIWDLATKTSRSLAGLGDDGFAVRFSPDGTRIAAASRDRKTHVWDVATGRELHAFDDRGLVRTIAFSPDGAAIASGCEGGALHVWDLAAGTSRELAGHAAAIMDLGFADANTLISASLDHTARVWDLASGAGAPLAGHRDGINRIAIAAGTVATASKDHAVRVWPLRADRSRVVAVAGTTATDFAFAADGKLATAWADGSIRLDTQVLRESGLPARQLGFAPDGKTLAWVGRDRDVHLRDLATGATRELHGHDSEVFALAFTDAHHVVTGSTDRTVRLWDLDTGTGTIAATLAGGVWSIAVTPDGRHVAAAGLDRRLTLIELGYASIRRDGHKASIHSVVTSADGKWVATAGLDETARVWSIDGTSRAVVDGHRTVSAVRFSPDAETLYTGAHDGVVRAWTLATREERVIARHRAAVAGIAVSPDGHHVASGGNDGLVWLVDTTTGAARIWNLGSGVQRIGFSRDGRELAAAGGVVRVWPVEVDAAPAATTARVHDDDDLATDP